MAAKLLPIMDSTSSPDTAALLLLLVLLLATVAAAAALDSGPRALLLLLLLLLRMASRWQLYTLMVRCMATLAATPGHHGCSRPSSCRGEKYR
jgi:hypothetical protein